MSMHLTTKKIAPYLAMVFFGLSFDSVRAAQPDKQPNSSEQQAIFMAYGASATSQELVAIRFHQTDGKLVAKIVQREPLGAECAPVIFHPQHRMLYVASLRAEKADGNRLIVFKVDSAGRLTLQDKLAVQHGSAYASFDRTGQFLLTASYFEGHVDLFRLTKQGTSPKLVSTTFENRDKAHSILTSPDNRFAYVPYVKDRNGLFQYAFDIRKGRLRPLEPPQAEVPAGVGPRHVAFHPTRPFVFFSNEQQLGATSYRIGDAGNLALVQVCQTDTLKPHDKLAASDIVITPDGRFLFVGARDFGEGFLNAIHRYQVHDDGRLTHLGRISTDAIPWGLEISPDGRYLLVTAAHGETLTAFEIDAKGQLEKRTAIKWGRMIRDIAVVALNDESGLVTATAGKYNAARHVELRALEGGGPTFVPRSERWRIRWSATTLAEYEKQLDFFRIELAAASGDEPTLEIVSNVRQPVPEVRRAKAADEKRLCMTWNVKDGKFAEWDRQILSRAGIATANRKLLQLYPAVVEDQMAWIEKVNADKTGHSLTDYRRTTYGIRGQGSGYGLYVEKQEYRPRKP